MLTSSRSKSERKGVRIAGGNYWMVEIITSIKQKKASIVISKQVSSYYQVDIILWYRIVFNVDRRKQLLCLL